MSPGNLHDSRTFKGLYDKIKNIGIKTLVADAGYKSCGNVCENCLYLSQCTESKNHVKLITRHIWENYMEQCEDVRHTLGMKKLYEQRKETIEQIFGTAKENHGFRYTQMYGKARMEMKVGLTFACMNLKKLAMMLQKSGREGCLISIFLSFWANNLLATGAFPFFRRMKTVRIWPGKYQMPYFSRSTLPFITGTPSASSNFC